MKLTIGSKLAFGFGAIISLLVFSAGIAYYNIDQMQSDVSEVLDEAVPTVRSSNRLLDSLNRASAALRGHLAFGVHTQSVGNFKAENLAAWEQANSELARLAAFTARVHSTGTQEQITSLTRATAQQRRLHQQIFELASAEDNVPARRLFRSNVLPRTEAVLELLTSMIDQEVTLEGDPERKEILKTLSDLRGMYAVTMADLRAYVGSGDQEAIEAFKKHRRQNESAYQKLVSLRDRLRPEQKQSQDRLVTLHEEIGPLADQVLRLRAGEDWNRAEHIWVTQIMPLGNNIRTLLDEITTSAEETERVQRGELDAASQTTVAALASATIVAILIGSGIAVIMSRKMAATIRVLAERARQISSGDLTGAAIAAKGADELGQLATGFDVMLLNLRDLTGQILSVTENVNSAALQISSSAKQQASSTKEQAATVQEITSTMQEISQAGAQIVAKAKDVAAAAEQASSTSKSGMEAVRNTNRNMEAIREQVEEVAENVVALSEKTQAVGEIIATVNDIAEQSNLLALNAAIEAADAGDEGNRFSVVAAEMKNLADQAKECTIHVGKILGEIQKAISTSVMLTEEAVKRVESGKQQADISEDVIRQISSTTEESIQAFQQIIGATNQQQIGFEQVAQGMRDIDQATQHTASGTSQLEQAVLNLSALGQQLQTAVACYKV